MFSISARFSRVFADIAGLRSHGQRVADDAAASESIVSRVKAKPRASG
jgi:hypothetical protein